MTGEMRRLTADGHTFDCMMVPATGERRGGLVIVQEIFGLTDQLVEVAAIYAAQGYDVAIPALFDRVAPGLVIPFDDAPRGRDIMTKIAPEAAIADISAAVAALAADGGKVAVMGFCWGGGLVVRAAQELPIAGAVSFYGTRLPQYFGAPLKAPVLGHFGSRDSHTPPDVLAAAREAFPELEMHLYEAGHAFANQHRPDSYDAAAAKLAHERTAAFIARVMA